MTVEPHVEDIDDQPIRWFTAPGGDPPVLYVHGVPDAAELWEPFLRVTGGVAPDLPGFGRSGKRGDFDYSIAGYDRWLERFLDHIGLDRFRLVVHDWGAVALALAQRMPGRIDRLVVINAVPFVPGYRWHRTARMWRTRGVGEFFMGATRKTMMRLLSREGSATPGPLPAAMVDRWWRDFDQGTQRAILNLYRSAPEDVLTAAGARLGDVECPALIVWGEKDPYLPTRMGEAYAEALPAADLRLVPEAGHWPWLDVPGVTDDVCRFLNGEGSSAPPQPPSP